MKVKLTKTFLNKFIKWSTSRYNEYRKIDVIKIIFKGFTEGKTGKEIYGSGSYCQCSAMTGLYDYLVDYDNKVIIKGYIDNNGVIQKEIERVEIII